MPKNVTLQDFLTEREIKAALKLYNRTPDKSEFNRKCREAIIEPVMERINQSLGQENDPRFLAYAVEYVFMHSETNKRPN